MKRKYQIYTMLAMMFIALKVSAQVGINTDNSTPDPSAMLDVTSTSKGLLIPRLTTAQRTAIASPAEGLLVYDTSLGAFYYYQAGSWFFLTSSSTGWLTTGNSGTDTATNFIGTTDNSALVFKTNGQLAGIVEPHLSSNTSFGWGALSSQSSYYGGNENTAFGVLALMKNHYGKENTAIGNEALHNNIGGSLNTAIGSRALY
jgi:hypothetical protein